MNYARHYQLLIEKARARGGVDGYSETHHVVPRSLGGPDDEENLVVLTGREHFLAHLLLWKANPNERSLASAAWMMAHKGTAAGYGAKVTSRIYEALRIAHGENHREFMVDYYANNEEARLQASEHAKAMWEDPDYRARMSDVQKLRYEDPEERRKIGRQSKANWKDPDYRRRVTKGISKARTGQTYGPQSEQHRRNVSKALKGKPKPPRTKEHSAKLAEAARGKVLSSETRAKIGAAHKGKVVSGEIRANMSKAAKARGIPKVICPHCGKEGNSAIMSRWHFDKCTMVTGQKHIGKRLTKEARAKLSAAKKGVPQKHIMCPHCGLKGGEPNMKRYHFDNCKQRKD